VDGIFVKKKKTWNLVHPQILYHEEELSNDFLSLLKEQDDSMITFIVGKDKENISAHKLIINTRCKAMEKQKKFPEIEKEEFNLILEYLYTGQCDFPMSKLSDILTISKKLNLKDLEEGIMDGLVNDINIHTIIDILNLPFKEIEKKAHEFFFKESNRIFQLDDIVHLKESVLMDLLSKNDISCPEIIIFKGLLKWNSINQSKNITLLLANIRFGLIKKKDLQEIVIPSSLVDSSIIDECMEYLSSNKKPKNILLIKPRSKMNIQMTTSFKNDFKINSQSGEITRISTKYGSM
jgi:hypothetical protein